MIILYMLLLVCIYHTVRFMLKDKLHSDSSIPVQTWSIHTNI
jgi:hypothetical protein